MHSSTIACIDLIKSFSALCFLAVKHAIEIELVSIFVVMGEFFNELRFKLLSLTMDDCVEIVDEFLLLLGKMETKLDSD